MHAITIETKHKGTKEVISIRIKPMYDINVGIVDKLKRMIESELPHECDGFGLFPIKPPFGQRLLRVLLPEDLLAKQQSKIIGQTLQKNNNNNRLSPNQNNNGNSNGSTNGNKQENDNNQKDITMTEK